MDMKRKERRRELVNGPLTTLSQLKNQRYNLPSKHAKLPRFTVMSRIG
jgi:hypothetical protein